jgi:very-short-patch-repair endonuclease
MSGNTNSSPLPLRRSDREAVREGGQRAAHHRAVGDIRGVRAKSLRRDMTEAERRLWYWLREHPFAGIAFRRQIPIGPFIVDFASRVRRLVIELDGGQHSRSKRDTWRERWLRSKDYRVLRYWNFDVLTNRDGVFEVISDAIARNGAPSRRSRTTPAIGDLPLKGEVRKGARRSAAGVGHDRQA